MHRLALSIELSTVQSGTGKVDPARKFKFTMAARGGNVAEGLTFSFSLFPLFFLHDLSNELVFFQSSSIYLV